MEAMTLQSPLNEIQIFLLRVFSRIKSEEEKSDIQSMLLDYYRKRVDIQANSFIFSDDEVEEILNSHLRTPYR